MAGKPGDYIRPEVAKFTTERAIEAVKQPIIEKRVLELQTLIPEAIKNCKKVNNLDACSEDIKLMLNFCVEVLGVRPKDCKLLVAQDLFN